MNCWKTINLVKDYGAVRIVLIAVCLMIMFFISNFLAFELLRPKMSLSDKYVPVFGILLVVTLLVHKAIHVLPIISKKRKIEKKIYLLRLRQWKRIPKMTMLISLLSPFFLITPVLFYAGLAFPSHAHYLCIISSIHCGYCLPDFLFALKLLKAPKACFIDQEADGFDILVEK
ncbi:DUF3267 domain-containing protein [Bacillus atrophaeus]|uniref:DUF3267 domain-containing protein n=1 Tax=Bacillus atrophaeus TaxID=1452 RepID=UPI001EFB1D80|nr:DUF3267 domain-containing protein [Bacillus atrophaeus]MCG8395907.1 DUF3267 domain-containing protein [Bacillus atrophaeus]